MSDTKLEVKVVGIFTRIAKISLELQKFRNLSENFAILAKFSIFARHQIFARHFS